MKRKSMLGVAAIAANLALVFVIGFAVAQQKGGEKGRAAPAADQQAPRDFGPITEYNKPLPADPAESALRMARNRKYSQTYALPSEAELQAGENMMRGPGEDDVVGELQLPVSGSPPQDTVPVASSDAVLVGRITSADAFSADGRFTLYSEFRAITLAVLKRSRQASVDTGSAVTFERYGGRMRLPSGRVFVSGKIWEHMPTVGGSYVLFLKWEPSGQDFSLITAYEVRDGRVYPLDEDPSHRQTYGRYAGSSATALFAEVERLVTPRGRQ